MENKENFDEAWGKLTTLALSDLRKTAEREIRQIEGSLRMSSERILWGLFLRIFARITGLIGAIVLVCALCLLGARALELSPLWGVFGFGLVFLVIALLLETSHRHHIQE